MDLQKHYDSYLESLKSDLLEHHIHCAKDYPTKKPDKWPTVYDYICEIVSLIKAAIANNDKTGYFTILKQHQTAFIALFEKMVKEVIYNCTEEYAEDLLKELTMGWKGKWVKFINKNYDVGKTNCGEFVIDWTWPFEEMV